MMTKEVNTITRLNAMLDQLIEFGYGARLHHNPLYDPGVHTRNLKPHRLDGGKEKSVRLDRIISGQSTVRGAQVRSIKDRILRGTLGEMPLPRVARAGRKLLVIDGNHRIAGALRAGSRKIRVLVQ